MPETTKNNGIERCDVSKNNTNNELGHPSGNTESSYKTPAAEDGIDSTAEKPATSAKNLNKLNLQLILINKTRDKKKKALQEGDVTTKKSVAAEDVLENIASTSGKGSANDDASFVNDLKVQTGNIHISTKMPHTIKLNEKGSADVSKNKTDNESGRPLGNSENFHNDPAAGDAIDLTAKETTTLTYDLNKFHLQRVLNNNTRNKSITLLGRFPHVSESDNAIVIFEKKAFQEGDVTTKKTVAAENGEENVATTSGAGSVEDSFFGNDLKVQTEFINNIYGSYQCTPPTKLSAVKATVVYPATDKHIEKYSICQKYMIRETPELYKNVTLPYITSSQFSLEWVYNILEHKQETERIVYEDPDPENGFILLPDLKWDGRNIENMYLLAIIHKRDIKSLRDLNSYHLTLLRNIRQRVAEEIEKRYGLIGTQLRMYFHYQPSFYHLHVHINPVRNDAPGIWCEKSHMLDTVIDNLELMSDYYERATLPFVSYEGNALLDLYEDKMPIRMKEVDVAADAVKRAAVHLEDENETKTKKPKLDIVGDTTVALEPLTL